MILWFGKKLCDMGFIINLKDRQDRLTRSMNELSRVGLEGVERFDACTIEDKNLFKYGCTKSHIEIAKIQIKKNLDYVLYLEDDILFDPFYDYMTDNSKINIRRISEEIIGDLDKRKPDILWLGVRPENYTKKISDCFLEPDSTLMSHAYVGSLKYAKFLVENLEYWNMNGVSGGWPIDFFISQITKKDDYRIEMFDYNYNFRSNDLLIYLTTPMIFNQGNSYSDLLDREVNYEEWIRGCYSEYANATKLGIKKFLYE